MESLLGGDFSSLHGRFQAGQEQQVSWGRDSCLLSPVSCLLPPSSERLPRPEQHLYVVGLARLVDPRGNLNVGGGGEEAEEIVEGREPETNAGGELADVVDVAGRIVDAPCVDEESDLRPAYSQDVEEVVVELRIEILTQLGAQHEDVLPQLFLGVDAADGARATEAVEALVGHAAVLQRLAEAVGDLNRPDRARAPQRLRAGDAHTAVHVLVVASEEAVVPIGVEAHRALAA